MKQLELSVLKTIKQNNMLTNGDKVVVGVSGGADSVALLYALNALKSLYNLSIVCAHLNHGIRGAKAHRDEQYVKKICKELQIDCYCKTVDIPAIAATSGQSHELCGRVERYKFFNEVVKNTNSNKIAVAHSKNDSVETVLIKLTRGCSLNGLRGISPVNGNVVRPLIDTEREQIELYLKQCGVDFMTDETNFENIYTRNIIRNKIIPQFKSINPSFITTVYNNSKSICDDDDFLCQYASQYYKSCVQTVNNLVVVDLNLLSDLHISIKKRIILYAVSILKGDKCNIENKHLDILCNLDKTGKKYDISKNLKAYTEYNKLIICSDYPANDDYEFDVETGKNYTIGNLSIKFEFVENTDTRCKNCMYVSTDFAKSIILRNKRSGDSFVPSGMTTHKKISRFFIDLKIPQNMRNQTPLLLINNEIAAVVGYRVSNNFVVTEKTKKILKISFDGGAYDKN